MRAFEISKTTRTAERLPTVTTASIFETRGLTKIEGSSLGNVEFVHAAPVHGLLAATYAAFAHHVPLVLSPDAVWIAIAQAVARHVDANAEALRSGLVRHQGQLAIDVRRDEFILGETNDWAGAIDELSELLRPHLGGRRDLFVADFSTTTRETRVASEVALLAGMQRFFSYSVSSLCGIPSIVLEGTPDDWANIVERVDALGDLGLGEWARVLRPVMQKIHASSLGEIDRDFWQRILKPVYMSGGEEVAGWINVLFPFLGDEGTKPNFALESWMDGDIEDDPNHAPALSAFPTGLSMAPFTWNYRDQKFPMTFCAGAFGVAEDSRGVRPHIGWVVAPRIGRRTFVARRGHDGRPSLSPIDTKTIENLLGLAEETKGVGAFDVYLGWCDKLASFEGAAGTDLASLSAIQCDRLESLEGLRGMTKLHTLSITQCSGLRDISALETLTGLKSLSMSRLPNVTDVKVIAKLRGLETLSVWHLPGLREDGQWKDPDSIARAQKSIS